MIRRVIIFVKISGSRAKWGRGNIVVVDIIIIIMSINNMMKNNRINIFELRVIIGRNLYTLIVDIIVKKKSSSKAVASSYVALLWDAHQEDDSGVAKHVKSSAVSTVSL